MAKKRYSSTLSGNTRDERVDAFIKEILEVCKRHSLSISHEDCHGAFIVEDYSEDRERWLSAAHNETAMLAGMQR
jgi:2-phospho-L-lactate guanylyltransferase (CobY/MobA/RfbA family)